MTKFASFESKRFSRLFSTLLRANLIYFGINNQNFLRLFFCFLFCFFSIFLFYLHLLENKEINAWISPVNLRRRERQSKTARWHCKQVAQKTKGKAKKRKKTVSEIRMYIFFKYEKLLNKCIFFSNFTFKERKNFFSFDGPTAASPHFSLEMHITFYFEFVVTFISNFFFCREVRKPWNCITVLDEWICYLYNHSFFVTTMP